MIMHRLFAGSYLNRQQQELLGRLKGFDQRLAELWKRKLRWVKPAKLHLTWQFLGDVQEADLPAIKAMLAELLREQPAVRLIYEQTELWPSAKHARQLVLVPREVPEGVRNLGKGIRQALAGHVSEPDNHEFRPHITLLRLSQSTSQQELGVPTWLISEQYFPLIQEIKSINLIESHLGQEADGYETLAQFDLC